MKRQVFVRYGVLFPIVALVLCIHTFIGAAKADTFGSGTNSFEIEFVKIGDAGNPADMTGQPRPAGAVPYEYRIGKYEISEQMIDKANTLGVLAITKDTRGPDKPATSVSWFEAARFVNWLNTSTGHTPAYKFVHAVTRPPSLQFELWEPGDFGYDPDNLFRNRFARYFLPSVDEWYKAAYYDPVTGSYFDYPTGSNFLPTPVAGGTTPGTVVAMQGIPAGPADIMLAGGLSAFGTMAQGGNVEEWEESELDLTNDNPFALRGSRGGGWDASPSSLSAINRGAWAPTNVTIGTGFRVARVIPEPSTLLLLMFAIIGFAFGVCRPVR